VDECEPLPNVAARPKKKKSLAPPPGVYPPAPKPGPQYGDPSPKLYIGSIPAQYTEVGRCRLTVSKPMLKAPDTKRSKLKYDKLLSSFAVNFNLRRYTEEDIMKIFATVGVVKELRILRQPSGQHKAGAYTRPLVGSE
jgi:hypothetical protein